MTIQMNEITREETIDRAALKEVTGGFYFNYFYQPASYNWLYQPILPLNTFAGALNNGWAIQGAAADRRFDSWLTNFRNS